MSGRPPAGPGVHVPPPLIFLVGFLAGIGLGRLRPLSFPAGARGIAVAAGSVLVAVSLLLGAWAVLAFRRARTTVLPFRPASRIVRAGPYRFSRNPMYVGLAGLYVGAALLVGSVWPLVLLPAVLGVLQAAVIRREERYLADAFGPEYESYRATVRRWL